MSPSFKIGTVLLALAISPYFPKKITSCLKKEDLQTLGFEDHADFVAGLVDQLHTDGTGGNSMKIYFLLSSSKYGGAE